MNQDGRDERIDQDLDMNQDGWDGRMDQDLGMNQDGRDRRIDQDYDMKIASLTIIDPNSVGAYCISPHPILNI
ncbi:hypothetical protein [Sphingobacterium mizutaii]|uniref:hypothetical protein n=1 Tax=Sphingobacterium mizutaii TaxID=1010 RepID=UPI003D967E26